MKRVFLLGILLTMLSTSGILAGPTISFSSKTYDFGTLREEIGSASCEFQFTNKGNTSLVIYKAIASCGCTTPIYSKEPIQPGASSVVKVSYSTTGRIGPFHKTITLYTNDPEAPNVVLIIKGDVKPRAEDPETAYPRNMQGLRLKRTMVPMLETRIGSIRTELVEVINTNRTPVNLSFYKVPKHLVISASNTKLAPGETGIITIKYVAANAKDYGKREDEFYILVNNQGKGNLNNRILVTANITQDFTKLSAAQMAVAPVCAFSENRIEFGPMARGSRKTMYTTLENRGKSNLIIRKIVSDYDGLKVVPEKYVVPAGKSARLRIDFNAGTFNGNVVQRVTIITNDPRASINRLFISAQVSAP